MVGLTQQEELISVGYFFYKHSELVLFQYVDVHLLGKYSSALKRTQT